MRGKLQITFIGQDPIVISQKQAAAVLVGFLVITPLGRLVLAGMVVLLVIAHLIGYSIGVCK